jgi:hypothetical protein
MLVTGFWWRILDARYWMLVETIAVGSDTRFWMLVVDTGYSMLDPGYGCW